MKVVVGLGNPGSEYAHTRHNLGYRVVDLLASRLKGTWSESAWYFFCRIGKDDRTLMLVKPTTYMNRSGVAVAQVLDRFEVGIEDVLVLVEHLPGSPREVDAVEPPHGPLDAQSAADRADHHSDRKGTGVQAGQGRKIARGHQVPAYGRDQRLVGALGEPVHGGAHQQQQQRGGLPEKQTGPDSDQLGQEQQVASPETVGCGPDQDL